jgi:hypothetical protein
MECHNGLQYWMLHRYKIKHGAIFKEFHVFLYPDDAFYLIGVWIGQIEDFTFGNAWTSFTTLPTICRPTII